MNKGGVFEPWCIFFVHNTHSVNTDAVLKHHDNGAAAAR